MYFLSAINKNITRNDGNGYHFLVDVQYGNDYNYHKIKTTIFCWWKIS